MAGYRSRGKSNCINDDVNKKECASAESRQADRRERKKKTWWSNPT